jgi:hypothetical protein
MKKTLVAPEIFEMDPTRQSGEDRSSKILVRPFVDHRRWGSHTFHRGGTPATETLFAGMPGDPAPDRDLISGLFVRALKQAGYDAVMAPVAMSTIHSVAAGCVVLEGQIWSFRFETRAAPVLEVDLSLQLRGGDGAEVLWQADFPEDNTVPLWIGLGCDPRDMAGAALKEVEAAVRQQFAARKFAESVRQVVPLTSEPASAPVPDDSHEVVAGSSWTGTDEGEIKATAHVSGSAEAQEAIPTADLYDTALRRLPRKTPQPAKV